MNVKALTSHIDCRDLAEVLGVKINKDDGGRKYGLCPAGHDSKSGTSFMVDKASCHCFNCGFHADAIGLYMEVKHLSFPEAVKELAERYAPHLIEEKRSNSTDLFKLFQEYFVRYGKSKTKRLILERMMEKRGYEPSVIDKYGLGCTNSEMWVFMVKRGEIVATEYDNSPFKNAKLMNERVSIPIVMNGKQIGFSCRGENPKYINIVKKQNYWHGLKYDKKSVCVVEGIFDHIALEEQGVHTVATMGTAVGAERLSLLKHYHDIILMFDSDLAGYKAVKKFWLNSLDVLNANIYVCDLPEKDPDECSGKEIKHALANKTPIFEWICKKAIISDSIDKRLQEIGRLKEFVSKAPEEYRKTLVDYVESLQTIELTPISEHTIMFEKIARESAKVYPNFLTCSDGVVRVGNISFNFKGDKVRTEYLFKTIHTSDKWSVLGRV